MWQDAKLLNAIANALFGLVLLALLASGVWWVIQRPLFTLQTVRVEGENKSDLRHVNALTIRDQAIPKIGGNFFTAKQLPNRYKVTLCTDDVGIFLIIFF